MRRITAGWRHGLLALLTGLLLPASGHAEIYLGVMGGINFNSQFSDVTSSGAFPDIPLPDAELSTSWVAGGKVGFYVPEYPWFGTEIEGFVTRPDFEPWINQGVDAQFQVITWALNALLRYPGERFQPYVGVGGGLFFAEIDTDLAGEGVSENWVPGLNILGGIRGYVTEKLGLFLEYKYTRADFNLQKTIFNLPFGFEGTYSANFIAAGLSYHFK